VYALLRIPWISILFLRVYCSKWQVILNSIELINFFAGLLVWLVVCCSECFIEAMLLFGRCTSGFSSVNTTASSQYFFPRGCYGQLFERLPAFCAIHFKCLRHLRSAAIFYRLDLVRSSSGNPSFSRLCFLPILVISKSLAPYFPLCAKEVSCSFFKESKLKTDSCWVKHRAAARCAHKQATKQVH